MSGTRVGYARCSTDAQDLTAQRQTLLELGVEAERLYLDHGLTGTTRARPGLDQALAAVRAGDTLVVPKLDRLARSVPDARAIGDDLAARGVALSLGASVDDPTDPMGKMFFNILATFAEFEVDLLRMRTREGMAVAKAKGRLKGRAPAPASSASSPGCTPLATTPSPSSPNCSRSPDPPCTASWTATPPLCRRPRRPRSWRPRLPYLRITCPALNPERRREIAGALTDTVVELFTPPRGPSADDIRARTTVHFTGYGDDELFIGGRPATSATPDVTVELSDWSMSTRQQRRVAARLTPLLVRLFEAEPDAVNLRFHPYPPTDFAVGGALLADRVPRPARWAKRLLG